MQMNSLLYTGGGGQVACQEITQKRRGRNNVSRATTRWETGAFEYGYAMGSRLANNGHTIRWTVWWGTQRTPVHCHRPRKR